MKKNRRLLGTILSLFCLTITGCNNSKTSNEVITSSQETNQIYRLYVNSGGSMSYEEWLESIKGADGSSILSGISNPEPSQGKNGDVFINVDSWDIFTKNGGSWIKIGNIMGSKGEQGPQGEPGVSVTNAHIDENGDLILELSNGETINAGNVKDTTTYTVTFDTDGGSQIEPQIVEKGGYPVEPEDPTREGYTFEGWVDENDNYYYFDFPVFHNMTLYAIWKEIPPARVNFWSCYGAAYTNALNGILTGITEETGVEIDHEPQGSYAQIQKNMVSAIAVGDYPHIAMGYPDHFYTYLSVDVLTPLDSYFTGDEYYDYYPEYMVENRFYDNGRENAVERTYGVPFCKSTEVLGYNGVFVDYCAQIDSSLANIPATWEAWQEKGPIYNTIFKSLFGKCVYGNQDVEGKASDFEVIEGNPVTTTDLDGDIALTNGKKLLLNMSQVNENNSLLMSWDATDNAFITLTRQWNAEYTVLPESEMTKIAKKRVGRVMFNSSTNQPKVIEMLKFFNRLNKQRIFGIPRSLGSYYSSDAFGSCRVMFMICSSGGLSYNTANWHHRFRVAPIPYLAAGNKGVISQGANICVTDKGEFENSVKVIKALTTGKFQTEWCLKTGYYPCSKSAANSAEYQAFLNEAETKPAEEAYASPVRVAYREGLKLNNDYYMKASEGWNKFIDPAFRGSDLLRQVVQGIFAGIFTITDVENDAKYKEKLDELKSYPEIAGASTIMFVD